jgi:formylglycine-generating enzyme required for sulfatase activity
VIEFGIPGERIPHLSFISAMRYTLGMSRKKNKNSNESALGADNAAKSGAKNADDPDAVHLKPLFGIKPGKYLAALYAAAILVILFFVLLYPGISNPGSVVSVQSIPSGAAVRVDDVYMTAAPCKIFVPRGKHTISAHSSGFDDAQIEVELSSRIFASLFFPKTQKLALRLTETAPLAALTLGARDYASWSFSGEPVESYQVPLSLSDGARRSAANRILNDDDDDDDDTAALEAGGLLEAAARFMTTQAAAKDLARAVFLTESGGKAASPLELMRSTEKILDYMRRNPAFAVALADILSDGSAGKLIDSPFYPEIAFNSADSAQNPKPAAISTSKFPLSVQGISFSPEFLAANYVQQSEFQHETALGNFMISLDTVSVGQWNAFLGENPEWQMENISELTAKKYVTEDYMKDIDASDFPAPARSGISAYAAEAFCRWLNTKLPASLAAAYEVRLPSEAEWEYAAKYAEGYFGNVNSAYVPRRMTAYYTGGKNDGRGRGVWEWCNDDFAPLNYLDAPAAAKAALGSSERAVRGGSWVNAAGTVSADTRASLAPDTCSPFAGFRVVLAART